MKFFIVVGFFVPIPTSILKNFPGKFSEAKNRNKKGKTSVHAFYSRTYIYAIVLIISPGRVIMIFQANFMDYTILVLLLVLYKSCIFE
jgi:hypothetical protein